MKTSEVFRLARQEIQSKDFWPGDQIPFICLTIGSLRHVPIQDRAMARRVIINRISPSLTIESWAKNHNLPNASLASREDFRSFRVRWLKALEEEFSAKGD